MLLAGGLAREARLDLAHTAALQVAVTVAMADAFIGIWRDKYEYNVVRPVTYLRARTDPHWTPLIVTPPFPEYPSGHSGASAAAAGVLTRLLGERPFVDRWGKGAPRSLGSFAAAAEEASQSRLFGGIHYSMGVDGGRDLGACVGRAATAALAPPPT